MKKSMRKLLALAMALCLLLGSVAALADGTSETITVGDVTVETGSTVPSQGGTTVTGAEVVVEGPPDELVGVNTSATVEGSNPSTADNVTVEVGTVNIAPDPTDGTYTAAGLDIINTSPDGGATVSAKDVSVSLSDGDASYLSARGVVDSAAVVATGGTDAISVDGSVSVSVEGAHEAGATGVATGVYGKTSTVAVTGGVTAAATTTSANESAVAAGVSEFASQGGATDVSVGGDVQSTATGARGVAEGVEAHADEGSSATASASGIAAAGTMEVTGVDAMARNSSVAVVTAQGDITAQSIQEGMAVQYAIGAKATATNGSAASVAATGDIVAADGLNSYGACAEASGKDGNGNASQAYVSANNISATSEGMAIGVDVYAQNEGAVRVDANNIDAAGGDNRYIYGVNVDAFTGADVSVNAADISTVSQGGYAYGVGANVTGSGFELTAEDVSATMEGSGIARGVNINANNMNAMEGVERSEIVVQVQSISAQAGDQAVGNEVEGLQVSVYQPSDIQVTVSGDIGAKSQAGAGIWSTVQGLDVDINKAGTVLAADVAGSVTAERAGANVFGVAVGSEGAADVRVGKDVIATGTDNVLAVNVAAYGEGVTNVSVGGNVIAADTDAGDERYGIDGIYATASGTGAANVGVMGDVTATGQDSVGVNVESKGTAATNVFVNGTVSGEKVAIQQTSSQANSNGSGLTQYTGATNYYIWQAQQNADGEIARVVDIQGYQNNLNTYSETVNVEATAALESAIWYIAKVQEAFASVLSAKGTGTYDYNGATYQLAHQEEDVALELNLGEGDTLEGVYYNAEDAGSLISANELVKDETTGQYRLKMRRGGAMLLGLKLCAHAERGTTEQLLQAASCAGAGSKKVTTYCLKCQKVLGEEIVAIPALAHTPGEAAVENVVPASCTAAGSYDSVVCCAACGAELSRTPVALDMLAHTPGEARRENEVAPQVGVKGSYRMNTYCSACGQLLASVSHEIDALPEPQQPSQPAAPAQEQQPAAAPTAAPSAATTAAP
ncbi:MAG: hypothetical protein IJ124_14000, partial [Clostridia bacterium]|nr:hypothetical protein [Clostridia bacterium]